MPEADPLDLLCHLAFNAPLRTRGAGRATRPRRTRTSSTATAPRPARSWTSCWTSTPSMALDQFRLPDVLKVPPISDDGNPSEIASIFGGAEQAARAVDELRGAALCGVTDRTLTMTAPRRSKDDQPVTTAQRLGGVVKSCRDIMRKDKGLNGDLDRLPMLTWIMFLKFLDDMERIREDEAALEGKQFRPASTRRTAGATGTANATRRRRTAQRDDRRALIAFINQDEAVRPDGTRGPGLFAYLRSLQGVGGRRPRDVIASVFRGTVNRMQSRLPPARRAQQGRASIHFSSSEEIHTLGHLYESMLKEMRDAAGDSGEFYTPRPLVRMIVAGRRSRSSARRCSTRLRARAASWSRRSSTCEAAARPSRTANGSSRRRSYGDRGQAAARTCSAR